MSESMQKTDGKISLSNGRQFNQWTVHKGVGWVKGANKDGEAPRVSNSRQPAKPGPKRAKVEVIIGIYKSYCCKRGATG